MTIYSFVIDKVLIKAGDTIGFIINAASWNANNCYMKMTATIATTPPEPVGDFNFDHYVNMADFSMFSSQWLKTGDASTNWCNGADIDQSKYVDMTDFAIFTTHWLEFTYPVGDLNFDNKVNFSDFSLFALQWLNKNCIAEVGAVIRTLTTVVRLTFWICQYLRQIG